MRWYWGRGFHRQLGHGAEHSWMRPQRAPSPLPQCEDTVRRQMSTGQEECPPQTPNLLPRHLPRCQIRHQIRFDPGAAQPPDLWEIHLCLCSPPTAVFCYRSLSKLRWPQTFCLLPTLNTQPEKMLLPLFILQLLRCQHLQCTGPRLMQFTIYWGWQIINTQINIELHIVFSAIEAKSTTGQDERLRRFRIWV